MTPTTQQIDRDLAEKVCGWTWWDNDQDWNGSAGVVFFTAWEDGPLSVYEDDDSGDPTRCFSPTTSRDDCAEVLAKVPQRKRGAVTEELRNLLSQEMLSINQAYWLILTAMPAQVAEAVWRATCQ